MPNSTNPNISKQTPTQTSHPKPTQNNNHKNPTPSKPKQVQNTKPKIQETPAKKIHPKCQIQPKFQPIPTQTIIKPNPPNHQTQTQSPEMSKYTNQYPNRHKINKTKTNQIPKPTSGKENTPNPKS